MYELTKYRKNSRNYDWYNSNEENPENVFNYPQRIMNTKNLW